MPKPSKARRSARLSPEAKRVEALEGVLRQIQREAQHRLKLTQPPERGWWEWVIKATESGLA